MTAELRTADGLVLELDRDIGSGAVGGVVHGVLAAAWKTWPAGAEVAVKRLHPHLLRDAPARHSLAVEVKVARAAAHPSLVRHLTSGEDQHGPFVVMEYIAGRTLREQLAAGGALPEPLVRSIAGGVAGALAALHAGGYVHADVKPDNIRIEPHGRVVLMDFGFAQTLTVAAPRRSVRSVAAIAPEGSAMPAPELAGNEGVNPGSLAYLSPERARGLPCTPASDVFALGVVVYELATAVHPYADDPDESGISYDASGFSSGRLLKRSIDDPGADRLLAALATARFVPPSRVVPQLSPFLDALLHDVLRRDPLARPSAAEVALRLRECERGAWWREQLDFGAGARRGTLGDKESPHLTPLVGREHELEALLERCSASTALVDADGGPRTPSGNAVWLLGPSGSGKSRLMSDCATLTRRRLEPAPLYLYGRCPAFEETRPCMPILRLVERYLRLPSGTAPGASQTEQLARLVPPRVATTLVQALTPDFNGTTAIAVPTALAQWLVALGRSQALLVFLDDVNFADEASLSVLARVAEELHGLRATIVLGLREHESAPNPAALQRLRERLAETAEVVELRLAPLSENAVQELVGATFHHSQPRGRIAQILFARSRGNPGLLAEILRGLIERGEARAFSPSEPRLVLEIAPERMPLPDSLHTLIQDRLLKASTGDREWLQRVSVIGGRIQTSLLERAFADVTAGEIDSKLAQLVHTGWLVPTGDRYRFARPALREAVYRSMSTERRVALHSRAADAFLPRVEDASGTKSRRIEIGDAFQRAFHLRAAERHADLLRLLRPLIQALLKRGQPQRVYVLARWGLEALAALPTTRQRSRRRIEFLEAAADAADRLGNREEQRQWLDELSELEFDPENDPDSLARVYLLHGRYAASTGQYGLARGMLKNSVELAQKAGATELESEALRRLGAVQGHVGELDDARELLRKAREVAVHEPQRAVAMIQLGVVDLLDNRLDEALRNVDEALRLQRRSRRWNLPGITAAAHMLRGRIYRVCGRPARALGSMQRAVKLAQQAGERRLELEATARLGGLLLDLNQPEEAETRLREALLIAGEIEDRRGQTLALLWLGTLLWEQGEANAASVLDRALRLANEMGLERAEALALAIRSRIEREAGRTEQALEQSERALGLMSAQGAELPDRIVVVGTRALVLEAVGRHDEAEELIAGLRRRVKRDNERIGNETLRKAHASATSRLLEAVLSPLGVIYPRVSADVVVSDAARES